MPEQPVILEEWAAAHPAWSSLLNLITELGQSSWGAFTADWHLSSHFLVAHRDEAPLGFLRYVVQYIGADAGWSPIRLNEEPLTEAKVIAFGVAPAHRRQGIGSRLQVRLIEQATAIGCYQVRSRSDENNIANYQLKLSLGFAIHPLDKTNDRDGVYFILPLRGPFTG
jgi:GNAT superfamily N-acetyltransferase